MDPDAGRRSLPSSWPGIDVLDLEDLLGELRGRVSAARRSQERLNGLLDAVVAVSSGLELDRVLGHIVEAACSVVGARYGALGVIARGGGRLREFVTCGITPAEREALGDPPQGHGVIGVLLRDPAPVRLADISRHPDSVGFPPNHPRMTSFLGAPVRVRDEVFGNIYLTEKLGAPAFDEEDEAVLVALAAAAGVAIENAQLFERSRRQARWAAALSELTRALLEGTDDDSALRLVAAQTRELSGSVLAAVALTNDAGSLEVRAVDADADRLGDSRTAAMVGLVATKLSGDPQWADWLRTATATRPNAPGRHDIPNQVALEGLADIIPDGRGIALPFLAGGDEGQAMGVLVALWAHPDDAADEPVAELGWFTQQASLALLAARARRDSARMAMLEERDRIARDMHDHVIQRLFATGLSLRSTGRMTDDDAVSARMDTAVDDLDAAIKDIRQLIFELHRPVGASDWPHELQELVLSFAQSLGFTPEVHVDGGSAHLSASLRADLLAVVREGLANVARHANASRATVRVRADDTNGLVVEIRDDGVGLGRGSSRSGLLNLGRRAAARAGRFEVRSAGVKGTALRWQVALGDAGSEAGRRQPERTPA